MMDIISEAWEIIQADATSLRESNLVGGEYRGSSETMEEIKHLEHVAACLYALMLELRGGRYVYTITDAGRAALGGGD